MNNYFVFLRQGTSQRNTDKRGAFLSNVYDGEASTAEKEKIPKCLQGNL